MSTIDVKEIIDVSKQAAQLDKPHEVAHAGFHELLIPRRGADEVDYERVPLPFTKPTVKTLALHTLTGLIAYLEKNVESLTKGDLMLHVVNQQQVLLLAKAETGADTLPFRPVLVDVQYVPLIGSAATPFQFGVFVDPEAFNVALQTLFVEGHDRAKVLECVGNVRDSKVESYDTDGISQGVTIASSLAVNKAGFSAVPNPVKLAPFRTFREIVQPESDFVLRARSGKDGQPPTFALFEADGAAWKLTAIERTRDFLAAKLTDVAILA